MGTGAEYWFTGNDPVSWRSIAQRCADRRKGGGIASCSPAEGGGTVCWDAERAALLGEPFAGHGEGRCEARAEDLPRRSPTWSPRVWYHGAVAA
jgi:hypothetical protein